MLEDKRIKEAESNVRTYLNDNMLKKQSNDTAKKMFFENSHNSLETAKKLLSLENKEYKPHLWVLVTSYYAMFYMANAVLLQLGYRIGNKIPHKVTSDALIVFVRNKLKKELLDGYEKTKEDALELISYKVDNLMKSFDWEREKRSQFQYQMEDQIKKEKATTSLNRAIEFLFEMSRLIK